MRLLPGHRFRSALAVTLAGGLLAALAAMLPAPAQADYRQKAEEQTDFIQAHFYDAGAKKYHDTYPLDPKALPWAFMWANGVQWRVLAAAAQGDPAKYRSLLDAFGQGIQDYWDPQGKPPGFNAYCSGPGGTDKYYDDNAWMALGFLEAYDATRDTQYLQRARATQAFVLSGWDEKLGGGVYWSLKHEGKNTCVSAPAAVAALRLARRGGADQAEQQAWAGRLIGWTNSHFQDTDGLYWDSENLDGKIEKTKWTYNTGLMIQADVLLFQTRGDRPALREAERVADAAISTWQDRATGAFTNGANFNHLLCEGLIRLYEADHRIGYLNAVRRHAAFSYRSLRDAANGGYWSDWNHGVHKPDERKFLLENASDARLFWLLTPYPDVDALTLQGVRAAGRGKDAAAEPLLRQAADSDTQAVEARYRLWRVLGREKKTAQARALGQEMDTLAGDAGLRVRLEAAGWKPPVPDARRLKSTP